MNIYTIFCIWFFAFIWKGLSEVFDSICDTLVQRKEHIFNRISKFKHPTLHKYMNLGKDWWRRKYVNADPKYGRKKIIGIPIHPMFYDGWHGFKVLRQWMDYNVAFTVILPVLILLFSFKEIVLIYIGWGISFAILISILHQVLYEGKFKEGVR